jgi:hypothetical protein
MYRYQSRTKKGSKQKAERERLTKGFAGRRQLLAQAASTIRTLTMKRNDIIAQALQDGLAAATVASLTGESVRSVRAIGQASEDLYRSNTSRAAHVEAIRSSSKELLAAETVRAELEHQRERLIARAFESTPYDILDLAIMSGLTTEQIRKTTRGLHRAFAGNAKSSKNPELTRLQERGAR